MYYYEVLLADNRYHGGTPLTYSSPELLPRLSVVSVPLRSGLATGFVLDQTEKPSFSTKEIRTILSKKTLPYHCVQLAEWLRDYYLVNFGEALRQFAPSKTVIRRSAQKLNDNIDEQTRLDVNSPLSDEQRLAINKIKDHPSTTVLLHGDTGSGKTRVYLELAEETLAAGRSVIILTPEIALTSQLLKAAQQKLKAPIYVVHSELSVAERKRIWFKVLESEQPVVIIGPRSALFMPIASPGLIVVDEAHEPAYKQEQSPRYHALRVASQLGSLSSAKVILGSATPSLTDYFLASERGAVVEMINQAVSGKRAKASSELIDIKDRTNFSRNQYLSDPMIKSINEALSKNKQAMLYFNRRGTARVILCSKCGWQMLCPNCDVPLVYHGDEYQVRCHICGHTSKPPKACPTCSNPDVVYKSIGTKTLAEEIKKLFPNARVQRFDSDNLAGEKLNEIYQKLVNGEVDILVGTQLLAKGLDLPKLNLVGIISAETSLSLPDFTAEERTFQLLYQVVGRVGRGHTEGKVVLQSYHPDSALIKASLARDWSSFYELAIAERQTYRFPPFSYLLKLVCRRATLAGAETAAENLKTKLQELNLPVEIIGPTPSFYARRGKYFYYQMVAKSKNRNHLTKLASAVPAGWTIDLDPQDLL
jgi:primosomal protein N' (replication factor Y)